MEFTTGIPVQRTSEPVEDVGDDRVLPETAVVLVDESWEEDRVGTPFKEVGVVVSKGRTLLELLLVDEDD